MAYRTPELVLIGAAQNLVLAEPSGLGCIADNVEDRSQTPELW
jgi:hypothetical protein